MELQEKEIVCDCGKQLLIKIERDWCTGCGKRVFYHEKDKKFNKWNTAYMWLIVLGVVTFLTYVFIELIVTPFMSID